MPVNHRGNKHYTKARGTVVLHRVSKKGPRHYRL